MAKRKKNKKRKIKARNELAYSLLIRTGGRGAHQDSRLRRKRTRKARNNAAMKEYE